MSQSDLLVVQVCANRLHAVSDPQFAKSHGELIPHRGFASPPRQSDLRVGSAGCHQPQQFAFDDRQYRAARRCVSFISARGFKSLMQVRDDQAQHAFELNLGCLWGNACKAEVAAGSRGQVDNAVRRNSAQLQRLNLIAFQFGQQVRVLRDVQHQRFTAAQPMHQGGSLAQVQPSAQRGSACLWVVHRDHMHDFEMIQIDSPNCRDQRCVRKQSLDYW